MGNRILNFGYVATFFFGLVILFGAAELMFYVAGWMIAGSLGRFLAWLIDLSIHQDYEKLMVKSFSIFGKACGILGGIYYFWWARGVFIRFGKYRFH